MNKQFFTMHHASRRAVYVAAESYSDARAQAETIFGPVASVNDVGVCNRPAPRFDRFPDMAPGVIFHLPERR